MSCHLIYLYDFVYIYIKCQQDVAMLLKDKILVGHALKNDLGSYNNLYNYILFYIIYIIIYIIIYYFI